MATKKIKLYMWLAFFLFQIFYGTAMKMSLLCTQIISQNQDKKYIWVTYPWNQKKESEALWNQDVYSHFCFLFHSLWSYMITGLCFYTYWFYSSFSLSLYISFSILFIHAPINCGQKGKVRNLAAHSLQTVGTAS